jgi:Subtilase family
MLLALPAAAAARDFDHPASSDTSRQFAPGNVQRQDTPNDPGYDRAEPDDEDGDTATSLYDERFDLFGFPSALTPLAVYKEGPDAGKPMISGFNAAGAWKLTRGEPSVAVAILDTGIKWDRESLRTKIRLNGGELPPPCPGAGAVLTVDDYACQVRPDAGAHGDPAKVDAEDLIATFSDGTDADGNGYVDDIAGWDFLDDDNDPYDASSYFAAANHGSGRAEEAAAATNDGAGEPGVCPRCQLMPLRIWDTFVSDQNTFALGMLYATDNGAKVIEGADGGLYHSAFAERASQYAYEHGVAEVFSGDDLNTGNHNYPANYDHTMLIQGTVPDTVGLGTSYPNQASDVLRGLGVAVGTQAPVQTYFRGAGTTQYGGHSSVAMEGSTGSENTGKASGAAAMVLSAALEHPGGPIELRPDETRAILEQTAEDVTGGASGVDGNMAGTGAPDRAQPGWDPHFGWGRVDLGAAVALAHSGRIPPEASIDSPDWFAPLTGRKVTITGLTRARFADGGRLHWTLEWGAGLAPTSWHTAASGDTGADGVRRLGTIDLDQVRAALAAIPPQPDPGMPTFAPSADPYSRQFTVRLTVRGDGIPTAGVDRKVLTALDDSTLSGGFPRRMAAGGEAPPRYADTNGDGTDELVLPLEDGTVHLLRPDGTELPGWPVSTRVQQQALAHTSAPGVAAVGAPHEPPRGAAVADLDDDGRPELITTAGIHIYAWEPDGSLRPGFPVAIDRAHCRPEDESQPLHHRKCGFLASPAVGRLEGAGKPLDIVAPALDGHVYAVRGDGSAVPGFPVALVDPSVPPDQQMLAESINNPAIGDLDGDGHDDVVAASNEVYGAAPGAGDIAGLLEQGLADLLAGVTDTSTRVYAISGATGRFLPGWPIKLNGGIQNTLPLIGPGHDPALVRTGGTQQVVVSATGGALSEYGADGRLTRGMQQDAYGPATAATDRSGALNLFESASVGDVLRSGTPDVVKYQTTLAGAANLLLSGQNVPWQHLIGAFDAGTGVSLPAFPAVTDDYQFLSSSTIARVDPASPANQVLAGSGLGELHAFDGRTGRDAPGFPKQTGGWLYAPATLSHDGRIADITREGFLFEWKTDAPACQPEWPGFRHDQQYSGNYDRDGTPPGAVGGLRAGRGRITFRAPGDDGPCRTLGGHYEVAVSGSPITAETFGSARRVDAGVLDPAAPGTAQSVDLPAGAAYAAIRAVDAAGNVGPVATVAL